MGRYFCGTKQLFNRGTPLQFYYILYMVLQGGSWYSIEAYLCLATIYYIMFWLFHMHFLNLELNNRNFQSIWEGNNLEEKVLLGPSQHEYMKSICRLEVLEVDWWSLQRYASAIYYIVHRIMIGGFTVLQGQEGKNRIFQKIQKKSRKKGLIF